MVQLKFLAMYIRDQIVAKKKPTAAFLTVMGNTPSGVFCSVEQSQRSQRLMKTRPELVIGVYNTKATLLRIEEDIEQAIISYKEEMRLDS